MYEYVGRMNLENLIIKQLPVGPMMNYAYLVGDAETKTCAVIDPGWEAEHIIDEAKRSGFKITHILATHTHFDHVNDLVKLAEKVKPQTYVHFTEAEALESLPDVHKVQDGDVINVGSLEIKVVHTPGHTPGSVCYTVGNAIFTGDMLFIDGIGRTDLDGGDSEEMFRSLGKLKQLPDIMVVYPGHNYGMQKAATLGEQKKSNPYLQCNSLSDFSRIA